MYSGAELAELVRKQKAKRDAAAGIPEGSTRAKETHVVKETTPTTAPPATAPEVSSPHASVSVVPSTPAPEEPTRHPGEDYELFREPKVFFRTAKTASRTPPRSQSLLRLNATTSERGNFRELILRD